ncbi:MAG: hypothetical protein ACLQGT_05875 [Terracidiphilus sp.]
MGGGNEEVTMLFDRILEWREHRNALTNERASNAAKSPVVGPLSDERSLMAAVKYVLKMVNCAIPAPLIREMLRELGFPMKKYTVDPLLSIHPTLKRMVAGGLVRQTVGQGKRRYWKEYEWIGPG